jgi:hypothetical protein
LRLLSSSASTPVSFGPGEGSTRIAIARRRVSISWIARRSGLRPSSRSA